MTNIKTDPQLTAEGTVGAPTHTCSICVCVDLSIQQKTIINLMIIELSQGNIKSFFRRRIRGPLGWLRPEPVRRRCDGRRRRRHLDRKGRTRDVLERR
jgi:hypothetical protein